MSAGIVVILGAILAAVILLWIITVLCYCRLQYYCCRTDDKPLPAASAPVLSGLNPRSPEPISEPSVTPTSCSPFYHHDDGRGADWWLALPPPRHYYEGATALGSATIINFYANRHAISTDV